MSVTCAQVVGIYSCCLQLELATSVEKRPNYRPSIIYAKLIVQQRKNLIGVKWLTLTESQSRVDEP